jgi:hypothetical protein
MWPSRSSAPGRRRRPALAYIPNPLGYTRSTRNSMKDPGSTAASTLAKKVDVNTWNFDLKMDEKVVGHVHRVISADGKTLTVHNTGRQGDAATADDTMVFDKQ